MADYQLRHVRSECAAEGNGQRIPSTDPTVQNLRSLIVVVKGDDEVLSQDQRSHVVDLATEISGEWATATWGRSAMSVVVDTTENDPPVNILRGPWNTLANTPLVFSSENQNQISISDPDVGNNAMQVSL